GDGGQVDVGGAGGVLLEKVRSLTAAVRASGWSQNSVSWRNIYTYLTPATSGVGSADTDLTATQNAFSRDNAAIDAVDTLALPASGTLSFDQENLILYMHGFESYEGPVTSTAGAEARKWVLGDVLHSRPLVFNYSKYPESAENYCEGSPNANGDYNSSIIFVGANDGMLHAFRDCDGEEIWAFIPPNALPTLQYFKDPQAGHPTFVDSAPSLLVHDENEDGTIAGNDKVILVFGQRRGGGTNFLDAGSSRGAYYALDVTDPDAPVFLWETDIDQLGEFGETWAQPRLAKVPVETDAGALNPDAFKLVAFVGTGYDNNEDLRFGTTQTFPDSAGVDINNASPGGSVDGLDGDGNLSPQSSSGALAADARIAPRGRGLAAIEIATYNRSVNAPDFTPTLSDGSIYWSYIAGINNYNGDEPAFSFASDLTVLDMNGDTFADTIYTGDTGGNLWRFKVKDSDPDNWTGTILFQSNVSADDGSVGRKIFYKPAVAYLGAPHIYFGTGDREHPLNLATEDRMYCIIDWGDAGTYPVQEDELIDVTANTLQDKDTSATDAQAILDQLYATPTSNPSDFTYGWYIKLDGEDRNALGDPGEKMLAAPIVFNGEVYFSTYQMIIGEYAGCEGGNLGTSRLYHLNYKTGEAVRNYDASNDLTGGSWPDGTNERALGAEGGELLQRTDRVRTLGEGIPSGIVPIIDASGKVVLLISSSDRVEAEGVSDIKLISPVYWMQW
ncbi:MAG TPA: hypothetical protein VJ910_01285, partial [Desulfuromonadales bacterium]|nr:hypothetical protein [Desulfuromonadales bacterium]